MARLTDKRYEAAKDVLTEYRDQLYGNSAIDCGSFEAKLRDRWGVGYQELKDIMADLLERPTYRHLAAYYMQNQNTPGPVEEFKPHLAKLYGLPMYDCPECEGARKAFWDDFASPQARGAGGFLASSHSWSVSLKG